MIFLQILQMKKKNIKADRCLDWHYSVPINYETWILWICDFWSYGLSWFMPELDLSGKFTS